MKLIKPLIRNGKVYTDVKLKSPNGADVADTRSIIDKTGDFYQAMTRWMSGCIIEFNAGTNGNSVINDRQQIKQITKYLSYRTSECLCIDIALKVADTDFVESVSDCPRCGLQAVFAQVLDDEGNEIKNTSDNVRELERIYFNDDQIKNMVESGKEPTYTHTLDEPVEIKSGGGKGEAVEASMNSLTFLYPDLRNCMEANDAISDNDQFRLQYRIYTSSIVACNGSEIDKAWRNRYGRTLFNKMGIRDIKDIMAKGRKYGLNNSVQRTCRKCQKQWKDGINPMGFFSSALDEMEI